MCTRAKQNLQLFFIDDHRLENVSSRLGKDSKIAILVVEILHVFRQNMPECGRDERRIDKRFVRLHKILEQKSTLLRIDLNRTVDIIYVRSEQGQSLHCDQDAFTLDRVGQRERFPAILPNLFIDQVIFS